MVSKQAQHATKALKSIARNEQIKSYIQQSSDLYPILLRGAKRFVAGETREEAIAKARQFVHKGYQVSLEYIGENTQQMEECIAAKNEIIGLITDLNPPLHDGTISLDLSHIGLAIDLRQTEIHLHQIADEARKRNYTVMISMEESSKTDQILTVYQNTANHYPNVGITVQAHLHRTKKDIQALLNYPGKIRLVKGAFEEESDIALSRSNALNERYLQLVEMIIAANHPLSVATHDQSIISSLLQKQLLHSELVECEMLYGISPEYLKSLKENGIHTRVYLTYGSEWYLYLCHRLAEFPPNLYTFIADMMNEPSSPLNRY
ncbi:proline dehydrogenase family protein [Halalkalibacter urbisdiaboli]|uniref:proline dehydrogenase family protein n=1 Tax=Halalkalibacter urbisdiaboli TaxID=1960589 RepID=UPI000B436C78|nr:proline dehydrogenase family protein [Halalkalibacter urbisdiaboli]